MDGTVGNVENLRLIIEIGFGFVTVLLGAIGGLVGILLYKIFDGIDKGRDELDAHVNDDKTQWKRLNRIFVRLRIEEDT